MEVLYTKITNYLVALIISISANFLNLIILIIYRTASLV